MLGVIDDESKKGRDGGREVCEGRVLLTQLRAYKQSACEGEEQNSQPLFVPTCKRVGNRRLIKMVGRVESSRGDDPTRKFKTVRVASGGDCVGLS